MSDQYSGQNNLFRARSVSDGWGSPVAHAPGSDSRCHCSSYSYTIPQRGWVADLEVHRHGTCHP